MPLPLDVPGSLLPLGHASLEETTLDDELV